VKYIMPYNKQSRSRSRSSSKSASKRSGRSSSSSKRSGRSKSLGVINGNKSNGKGNSRRNKTENTLTDKKMKLNKKYSFISKNDKQTLTQDEFNSINETVKKLYSDAKDEDLMTLEQINKMEQSIYNKNYSKYKKSSANKSSANKNGGATIQTPLLAPQKIGSSVFGPWCFRFTAWPPNYGCRSVQEATNLFLIGPCKQMDRFGDISGCYLGTPQASYVSRSIPFLSITRDNEYAYYYTHNNNDTLPEHLLYHKYTTIVPFFTFSCLAAAAFDKPGGAKQFLYPALPLIHYDEPNAKVVDASFNATQRFYTIRYLLSKNIIGEVSQVYDFPDFL